MRTAVALVIACLTCAVGAGSAWCSDWEEDMPRSGAVGDTRPSQETTSQTIHSSSNGHGGHVLQGSATTVRTIAPPTLSAYQASRGQRDREVAAVDAGADRFMATLRAGEKPAPPQVFRNWIHDNHPEFALDAKNSGLILNVKGQWDNSARPLGSLGIPQTSIKEKALKDIPLDGVKVIIVNCAGELPREALQKIRDFVIRGGYLITTDWSLGNVLEKAFPGYIAWNGENTSDDVVDSYIAEPDAALFKGVPERRSPWKLDRGSQTVKIVNAKRVHVLVRSTYLAIRDPNLRVLPDRMMAGALACLFAVGRGKVLHVVGHYDNCSFHPHKLDDPSPGIGISLRQALITNFVLEGLSQQTPTSPPDENPLD